MRQPTPSQILEWKQRRGLQSGIAFEIQTRITDLERAWNASPEPYLAEFIPMRITTCVEVYTREIVRELIDTGGTYLESAGKLAKNAKLDLVFAAHLSGQKLSIGDFVAHTVSINGIDAVMSAFSTLIVDFGHKLRTSHPRWSEETESWPLDPILRDYDQTIGALARMFEARHVLTHELPDCPAIQKTDATVFCEAARNFIDACDWVVVAELHGSVPRTQIAMNIDASSKLDDASNDLKMTLDLVAGLSGVNTDLLKESHAKWMEFADLEATMIASQVKGGSMYPMLWASAKEDLMHRRVAQFKSAIEDWMD